MHFAPAEQYVNRTRFSLGKRRSGGAQ